MIEWISQPWPWYVSGPLIAFVMFLLLYFGKEFGVSANLRTMCSMAGAGRVADFFKFDWKSQLWNLVFVMGALIGGIIADQFLAGSTPSDLSAATISELNSYGIFNIKQAYIPLEIISFEALTSLRGIIMLVGGGILVGFGTRYAGGCTSGHAISGMSNLQLPSLIAVVGFFIGGLTMTYFILPHLLTL